MEEKRGGQAPETEIATSDGRTAQQTAAPGRGAVRDKPEDPAILKEAQDKANADRKLMRRHGFGDHKGGDIS